MKKALAALLLTGSGIAVASPALADDPPPVPVTPGPHSFIWRGTAGPVTAVLDCGPACFSLVNDEEHDEFRWVGDKWLESGSGMWTVDGVTFTNRNGRTATLS